MRAKFFRGLALRPPLPSLRQILFFALADFFKISVLDRFFSWGFAPIFLFFPPLSEIFRTILFHAFSTPISLPFMIILYTFFTVLSTFFSQFLHFFCVSLLSFCVGILYNSVFRLCSIYCVIVHLYFKVA